ncbi:Anthranilate synthase component 1 [Corynebacterium kalinowskii]|uniref:anthranilate synthase n=1 Tax=Corynebacterium kalinowskii TaxID=2675216 RepID=A0A6B8VX35_9CORY|nr:chorismate-binding protein [Corynebacterium kalinowskii]QGU03266.1 Anthranilate synthase component 1 [Corynebacterium kalinowskii]
MISAADIYAKYRGPNTALLESADLHKNPVKSLAILKAKAKLTCVGDTVTVQVLSPAGESIAAFLDNELQQYGTGGVYTFPRSSALDERDRLKEPSSLLPLKLLEFDELLIGGFAFDYLESFEDLPPVAEGLNTFPDYEFLVSEISLHIDHATNSVEFRGGQPQETSHVSRETSVKLPPEVSDSEFEDWVRQLQGNIHSGDIYQAVPSRAFVRPCTDAFAAYLRLKESNPSPYLFYIEGEDYELFGASPESSLKYDPSNRQIELYPIAGTQPRGATPEQDERLELLLRTDAKEIAEHTMLVDLARNDLARVCTNRQVTKLMGVDKYSRVMHLVSQVTGTLAPDLDALDAYRACMNMGTLTGAPKIRATELIRGLELARRGSYGGAVGYLHQGVMDTCIVIRSAFVKDGIAIVQAGAGVVRDSIPASEAAETKHKAKAVLEALQ